jgi:hypothetical protein
MRATSAEAAAWAGALPVVEAFAGAAGSLASVGQGTGTNTTVADGALRVKE